MSEYIKLFNNHNEYTAFTQTEEFVKPNVSHCILENEVHYNPYINPCAPITGNTGIITYEAVDLGLPSGTLWANKNIGAQTETDYGLYFAWGETDGYTAEQVSGDCKSKAFSWLDYKYGNGNDGVNARLTKYCNNSSYGIDGFIDNLTELENIDDAAHIHMGGDWRMPTREEQLELLKSTKNGFLTNGIFTIFQWNDSDEDYEGYSLPTADTTDLINTNLSGATGYLFFKYDVSTYSTAIANGDYLFLPACGYADEGWFNDVGSYGVYWSKSVYTTYSYSSWKVSVGYDAASVDVGGERSNGRPIRGVLNH